MELASRRLLFERELGLSFAGPQCIFVSVLAHNSQPRLYRDMEYRPEMRCLLSLDYGNKGNVPSLMHSKLSRLP